MSSNAEETDMALLATRRRHESERPSFTRSVDAAFGFVDVSRRVPGGMAEDLLLALGCIAEETDAVDVIRSSIAEGIASIGDRTFVPTRAILDRLLDLRIASARSDVAART